MKKMILITVFLVLIFSAVSVSFSALSAARESQPAEASLSKEKEQEKKAEKKLYLVKEYKGLVAVFENGGDLPVRITETSVCTLPQFDIINLSKGIEVEGKEELEKLLNDFCS